MCIRDRENKKGAIPTEHIDVIFNKICEIKGLTDQLFDYSLACNEEALELDAPCNMESAIGDYLSEMAFIPVSYTHLDVYKRQSLDISLITARYCLLFISIPAALSLSFVSLLLIGIPDIC